jgi:hypothetical protein
VVVLYVAPATQPGGKSEITGEVMAKAELPAANNNENITIIKMANRRR